MNLSESDSASMPEWFVYNDRSYYPYARIVRAETPEKAAEIASDGSTWEPLIVFPADAMAYISDELNTGLPDSLRPEKNL